MTVHLEPCGVPMPAINLGNGIIVQPHLNCTRISGHEGNHQAALEWPQEPPPSPTAADPTLN